MKELLDKLSSYNIFNYLLPGVLFAVAVDSLTPLDICQKNIVVGVFVYYFLGTVVSRIGSLVIDPVLRKTGFIASFHYDDFVRAAKIDPKLEVLSETNNMYRTLCSLLVTIAVVYLYAYASNYLPVMQTVAPAVSVVALFLLFVLSYKKQSTYISKRIRANLEES